MIKVTFSKKVFYSFVVIMILLLISVGLYAIGGSDPSVMGHNMKEIKEFGHSMDGVLVYEGDIYAKRFVNTYGSSGFNFYEKTVFSGNVDFYEKVDFKLEQTYFHGKVEFKENVNDGNLLYFEKGIKLNVLRRESCNGDNRGKLIVIKNATSKESGLEICMQVSKGNYEWSKFATEDQMYKLKTISDWTLSHYLQCCNYYHY